MLLDLLNSLLSFWLFVSVSALHIEPVSVRYDAEALLCGTGALHSEVNRRIHSQIFNVLVLPDRHVAEVLRLEARLARAPIPLRHSCDHAALGDTHVWLDLN